MANISSYLYINFNLQFVNGGGVKAFFTLLPFKDIIPVPCDVFQEKESPQGIFCFELTKCLTI
jgi:hypothetical protein